VGSSPTPSASTETHVIERHRTSFYNSLVFCVHAVAVGQVLTCCHGSPSKSLCSCQNTRLFWAAPGRSQIRKRPDSRLATAKVML
jgi:hypothetical protein